MLFSLQPTKPLLVLASLLASFAAVAGNNCVDSDACLSGKNMGMSNCKTYVGYCNVSSVDDLMLARKAAQVECCPETCWEVTGCPSPSVSSVCYYNECGGTSYGAGEWCGESVDNCNNCSGVHSSACPEQTYERKGGICVTRIATHETSGANSDECKEHCKDAEGYAWTSAGQPNCRCCTSPENGQNGAGGWTTWWKVQQCTCETPGAGTANHNKYTCSDGTVGYCGSSEECFATGTFSPNPGAQACRVPAMGDYCETPQKSCGVQSLAGWVNGIDGSNWSYSNEGINGSWPTPFVAEDHQTLEDCKRDCDAREDCAEINWGIPDYNCNTLGFCEGQRCVLFDAPCTNTSDGANVTTYTKGACHCAPDCESDNQCGGADDGCGGRCDEVCPSQLGEFCDDLGSGLQNSGTQTCAGDLTCTENVGYHVVAVCTAVDVEWLGKCGLYQSCQEPLECSVQDPCDPAEVGICSLYDIQEFYPCDESTHRYCATGLVCHLGSNPPRLCIKPSVELGGWCGLDNLCVDTLTCGEVDGTAACVETDVQLDGTCGTYQTCTSDLSCQRIRPHDNSSKDPKTWSGVCDFPSCLDAILPVMPNMPQATGIQGHSHGARVTLQCTDGLHGFVDYECVRGTWDIVGGACENPACHQISLDSTCQETTNCTWNYNETECQEKLQSLVCSEIVTVPYQVTPAQAAKLCKLNNCKWAVYMTESNEAGVFVWPPEPQCVDKNFMPAMPDCDATNGTNCLGSYGGRGVCEWVHGNQANPSNPSPLGYCQVADPTLYQRHVLIDGAMAVLQYTS